MIEKILNGRGKGVIITDMAALEANFRPTHTTAWDIETFGVDKLPGDSPFSGEHGIAGLAVGNSEGEAVYILVDDAGGKRPGIPVAELAAYANKNWLCQSRAVVFHNAKFDLGFLAARGFDFSKVDLWDTWILHTILCKGVFVSNRLKDITKARFGIEVISEEVLKRWLDEHQTMDYGEIPVELIGPYACDDVRYALALCLSIHASGIEQVVLDQHAKFLDLTWRLIQAEAEGFAVDVPALKKLMDTAKEKMAFYGGELQKLLKAVAVSIDDDQAMLGWLHQQNLHPGRSDFFGEPKFYFDREALNRLDHPVVQHYRLYYVCKAFLEQFSSSSWKGLRPRVSKRGSDILIHPSYLLSIFSRGGVAQVKKPELHTVMTLTDAVRGIVRPKAGRYLVQVQALDLPITLLAHYCQDNKFKELLLTKVGPDLCRHFGDIGNQAPEVISLLLSQYINGYGDQRLIERLQAIHFRVTRQTIAGTKAKLVALLPCLNDFKKRLLAALEAEEGYCKDIVGAPIAVVADKRYRAQAILLSSGCGNILSFYLSQLCKAADAHGAKLVFARDGEFLFEATASGFGTKIQDEVFLGCPMPVRPTWRIWDQERDGGVWRSLGVDAHAWTADKLFSGGFARAISPDSQIS